MSVIAIVGLGQIGSALCFVAAENGHEIRFIGTPVDGEVVAECVRSGRHPKLDIPYPSGTSFYPCSRWQEAVAGADFVVGAISSLGVEWFLREILVKLDPAVPVLSAAKGLTEGEDGSLVSFPEYWERALEKQGIRRPICALGGPGTAYEIMHGVHTHVVLCGCETEQLQQMKQALQTSWFHISLTEDAHGLEVAVAIKNAFALGVAMALGQAKQQRPELPHVNLQAAVFAQAAREMMLLLEMHQAGFNSAMIGIGDLFVTVTGARTRELGLLLGAGKSVSEARQLLGGVTLESLQVLYHLGRRLEDRSAFPLLSHILSVVETDEMREFPWEAFTFQD